MPRSTPASRHARRAPRPRVLFPQATALIAAALITEGDGRPALYIVASGRGVYGQILRVPGDARVTVHAPRPLPGPPTVFLPTGARVTFETPGARSTLALHGVHTCRELLDVIDAHAAAALAWLTGQRADAPRAAS